MKKLLLCALAIASVAIATRADITINVNPALKLTGCEIEQQYIADKALPRDIRPEAKVTDCKFTKGKYVIKNLPDSAAVYTLDFGNDQSITLYASPVDNYTLHIESLSPMKYSIEGNPVMASVSELDRKGREVTDEYRTLMQSGMATDEMVETLEKQYLKIYEDFMLENADSPAYAYALLHTDGETFLQNYEKMPIAAKQSIFMPLVEREHQHQLKVVELRKRQEYLNSGEAIAPDFTFQNMEGKEVKLSDFRGKWVIIDFWGTWCPWCIRGFPALKAAYSQYKDKLEVVGVACRDSKEAWEAGVKKFELPWVNLYNPDMNGGKVLEDYAVEGFPTKVIVTPEGKVAKIVVGEDPAFFNILSDLLETV